MKVRYDDEADALYVPIEPDVAVARSVVVDERRVVDLDDDGEAIGIEILDASQGVRLADLAQRFGLERHAAELLLVEAAARPPKHH